MAGQNFYNKRKDNAMAKKSRKLAQTFVRKGTCRQVRIKNDDDRTMGWVHIEYTHDNSIQIHEMATVGTPKAERVWNCLLNCMRIIIPPKKKK